MDNSNNTNSTASNVAQAILAVLDYNSTPDARKAAVAFLESIKSGDIRVLANISLLLVKKECSSEIRLHAFKMLQHLVRLRWEELSPSEHRDFAKLSVELMAEIANPSEEWSLKSQSAALVAEIVRREGPDLWQDLFPSLSSLSAQGPLQAEVVSMMLRWLPEDITVHNEDLEGDRRRLLLRGLTQSLPEILPLLYNLLERHFGAAMSEASRQQVDLAKQHAAVVIACLNAINAYAEWAPVLDLSRYGIINGCGVLLSSTDFRLHACEFFKLVCSRKRPSDAPGAEFDSAINSLFQSLMNVSREFLYRSASNAGVIDESDYEFAECICESLVSLGSTNLQCIATDGGVLALYLQQMLGFFQHFKLGLHFEAMQFWLALMRDLLSKPKAAAYPSGEGPAVGGVQSSSQVENEKKKILSLINDEISCAILDVSFQRMLKKEKFPPRIALSLGPLELWSDDFEGKGDFGQYRSRLLELIKFIASHKPLVSSTKIAERIITLIKDLLASPVPLQDVALMDSQQLAFDYIVATVFDGSNEFACGDSEVHFALRRIFEGLLQQLLSLKWTEPELIKVHAHYLDAMGPYLKYFPDAVGSVINKLSELFTSLPHVVKDPATSTSRIARLQIYTSFIRMAKAAEKSVLPHMKIIQNTTTSTTFDEMIETLEELPLAPLTAEGMDVLAAVYTNAVEIRREKLRSSSTAEEGVESYIEKIESEISEICQKVLKKVEEINLLVAEDDITKPFYGLMEERFRGYQLDLQIGGYLRPLPKDLFPEVLSILQDTPQKTTLALHMEELLSNLPGPDTLQPLDLNTLDFRVGKYRFRLIIPADYPTQPARVRCLCEVERWNLLEEIDEEGFLLLEEGLTLHSIFEHVYLTFSHLDSSAESEKDRDLFN